MKQNRRALKQYIINYHKTHGKEDCFKDNEYMLDDELFFNLNDTDNEIDYVEALEQITEITDTSGIHSITDTVLQECTEKEIAIYFCLLQGKSMNEMNMIFMIGKAQINNYIDRIVNKVIEDSH
ncbi:hypothetical protein ACMGE5_10170 [Macrococcus equi]|uniref:hypothetical protein n=1 Tax=Macrococcus equi TaxID=3395462 RepID=UPI0039BE9C1B